MIDLSDFLNSPADGSVLQGEKECSRVQVFKGSRGTTKREHLNAITDKSN